MRRGASLVGIAGLIASALLSAPASGQEVPAFLPPGFTVTTYGHISGLMTSLDVGPDTTQGSDAEVLYGLDYSSGRVFKIADVGGSGGTPTEFAGGFASPLGVLAADDGTVYVADSTSTRKGPFGTRVYGRVWRVRDTDGDGVADKQKVILKDLPNGRHNTNGMAIGPDGKLYVANGNSTDDGTEGGDPEVVPWSGSVVRINPNRKTRSLADLPKRKTLVATGMRNLYDVAFFPLDPTLLFIPMNGADDARQDSQAENPVDPELGDSDDLLYATDVDDGRVDDFGFPSCLYNVVERGNLEPYQNPNKETVKRFGKCPKATVPRPVASFGLHTSSDGAAFQTTDAWGPEFQNNVFVAEFGNFFGAPAGHDVVRVVLNDAGEATAQEKFFAGGTPIDLAFDRNGVMFVADFDGTIYRITKAI